MDRRAATSLLRELFAQAVSAVDPYALVSRLGPDIILPRLRHDDRVLAAAFGKAAHAMAAALQGILGDRLERGVLVTKYGHLPSSPGLAGFRLHEAGHPVPDAAGEHAARQVMALADSADERTLFVCLISGGGSALLVSPWEGITLREKQEATRLLLCSGADIGAINTVRKHLSRVKGGRLAERAAPARVVSLILSDVVGDPLDVIASGPTAPDHTTYADALAVARQAVLPAPVTSLLQRGAGGDLPETPKPGAPLFQTVSNLVVGNIATALKAVEAAASSRSLPVTFLPGFLTGEARQAARVLADRALGHPRGGRSLLLSGGETTVTVTGDGLGGRNTELALAFAMAVAGQPGVVLLSAGTDGNDGPTDAAGAFADGTTVARALALGLDPEEHLRRNDSYTFFEKLGDLLVTGPTGTNVMDIQMVLT